MSHRVLPVPLPGLPPAALTSPASPAACSFRLTVPGGETAILVYTTAADCTTLARTLEPAIVRRTIAVTALGWFIPTVPPTCSSVSSDQTPLDVYPDGTHYVAALALCARPPGS